MKINFKNFFIVLQLERKKDVCIKRDESLLTIKARIKHAVSTKK